MRQIRISGRTRRYRLGRRSFAQLGLRHWSPVFCHVLLVHQPVHRAIGIVERTQIWQIRQEGVRLAEALGRKGCPIALGKDWRQVDQIVRGTSRVH